MGQVIAFFLFDVADAVVLDRVSSLVDASTPARLAPKSTTPPYVQYHQPPLGIDGAAVGVESIEGFTVRFKVFDYGVVSIALTQQVALAWDDLLIGGFQWYENARLMDGADAACRTLVRVIGSALERPRPPSVGEDYLVFAITHGSAPRTADALIAEHGAAIAQLLRGERDPLSAAERDDVLRHRISYLADDLVVPTWNAAFVYDTAAGVNAALEILEFANSQLLEFRFYDELLDAELERIYGQLQRRSWPRSWFGRRYARAAKHVHTLYIDVNELTDKTENALKIAGDVYAARLFALVAARLGLDHWKNNVRDKLQTLGDIYRFAVDQTAMTRMEFLELITVLILILELVLLLPGFLK
jgi:hypothetical protein